MSQNEIKFAFAGDRDIAVWVLKYILNQGFKPEALLVPELNKASHGDELIELCSFLAQECKFIGKQFREKKSINYFNNLNLGYIISIHFPYIIPSEVLSIPKFGILNLHPAYLPYNRGWHTPSWAILEDTPIGATLHFMEEELDSGDIVFQESLKVLPEDTAHSLYMRLKKLEYEVFKKSWPLLISKNYKRKKQCLNEGTSHKKKDLFIPEIQEIDMNKTAKSEDIIKQLKALTTNDISEAAYFIKNGKKYRIQIKIVED